MRYAIEKQIYDEKINQICEQIEKSGDTAAMNSVLDSYYMGLFGAKECYKELLFILLP